MRSDSVNEKIVKIFRNYEVHVECTELIQNIVDWLINTGISIYKYGRLDTLYILYFSLMKRPIDIFPLLIASISITWIFCILTCPVDIFVLIKIVPYDVKTRLEIELKHQIFVRLKIRSVAILLKFLGI